VAKRLTAAFVKGAEPGVYGDQFGLRLRVLPTGGRQWIWRGTVAGRRVDLGLGGYPVVTLAEARELALDCKRAAWRGNDPRAVRNRRTAPTFTEATEAAIALHAPTWKNPRTESQWRASLAAHAYPVLGRLTVDTITVADVFRVLSTIWSTKPAIAGHLRTRVSAIMKWTIAQGYRLDDPAGDALAAALPRQNGGTRHHRAAAHGDVAEVLRVVRESGAWAGAKLAVAFTALTATRGAEARGARWSELDGDTWNIPGERMKTGKPHRIPLARQSLAILDEAREVPRRGGDLAGLVFPRLLAARRRLRGGCCGC
jgi:integrase